MRHIVLAFVAFSALRVCASPTDPFPPHILINITNQVWQYYEEGQMPDPAWMMEWYDGAGHGWKSGRSALGREGNVANWVAVSNTVLNIFAPGGSPQVYTHYFRTTFTFNHDPGRAVLISSNLIDDGVIVYLNGMEVARYNMNPNPGGAAVYGQGSPQANPGGEGNYIPIRLDVTPLRYGENLLAVELHQNGLASSDVVWGTTLHAHQDYSCRTIYPGPTNLTVLQGRSAELQIQAADCSPVTARYQWFKDFAPIQNATNPMYRIHNMTIEDAGTYYCEVSNSAGTVTSHPFEVFYVADEGAPILLGAAADPFALNIVRIRFNEPVTNADVAAYYILERAAGLEIIGLVSGAYNAARTQVTFTLERALERSVLYWLTCLGGVEDPYGNRITENSSTVVSWPVAFRQDAFGYTGTEDTEIHSGAAANTRMGDAPESSADLDDVGIAQGLLRFNDLVGYEIGPDATILHATLRLFTVDGGSPVRVSRMLGPWTEDSTWDSLVNGVDVEIGGTDAVLDVLQGLTHVDVDVTAAVQAWVNGGSNYGWAFLSTGGNGSSWATSEHTTDAWRPTLLVEATWPPPYCEIVEQPQSVHLTEEGYPHQLTVVARGNTLSYQWYKDNVAIPGATYSSHTLWGYPRDAGTYTVVVTSGREHGTVECISQPAVVTVHDDPQPLRLLTALGNPDQTTIDLWFDNGVGPLSAQNTDNYVVSGGVTVLSASVSNTFFTGTVTLTTTPRAVGQNYTVEISNLTDDTTAANMIFPNPTTVELPQRVRLVPFDQPWKYHNEGMDLGTTWKELNYDDAHWNVGPGLLGFESTANTLNMLSNQNIFVQTTLSRYDRSGGNPIITDYFRTRFQLPFYANSLILRHVVDDGAVFYLNGQEITRFNLTNGPVNYQTPAIGAPTEGMIRSTNISRVLCPDNLLAVEVHQNGAISGDVLFGLELLADVPQFVAANPFITIQRNENGTVTLSWCGALYESEHIAGPWTPLNAPANPLTIFPTGTTRFYTTRP